MNQVNSLKNIFVMTQSLECPSGAAHFGPLARQLAKLGHQITILAIHPNWAGLSRTEFQDQDLQVKYVGQMHVRKIDSRKLYFNPIQLLWISLVAVVRLAWELWKSDAEVITLCKPQPINSLAVHLGRRGRPVYVDSDDYEVGANRFSNGWQQKIVQFFEDNIVNHAKGIAACAHFSIERYANLGYPRERLVYFPVGVERQRFEGVSPQAVEALRQKWGVRDRPVVMYVGTMSMGHHWVHLLLEAYQAVAEQCPEARLMMLGGGEDYENLKQMSEDLGLTDKVIFVGRVSPDEVPTYLQLATITVEIVKDTALGQARAPLKVVESLASGVPVITGDLGERPAMLAGGQAGILVKPDSVPALAEGISEALLNKDRLKAMKQGALNARERLYWDVVAKQFAKVYEIQ